MTVLGDYHARLMRCVTNNLLENATAIDPVDAQTIPHWVPIDIPRPDELGILITSLAHQGTAEADHLLLHTKLAHGSTYLRALASREALQIVGIDGGARIEISRTKNSVFVP